MRSIRSSRRVGKPWCFDSFGEQGVVYTLSFVLVLGSEMGLGGRASAAFGRGLAVSAGWRGVTALMHVERITARDRVRYNLADFHSCSYSRASELSPPIQVVTNHRP